MKGATRTVLFLYLTVLFSALALAANGTGWEGWDRLGLDIGVFASEHNTSLRLDATDGTLGTEVDWEDNLQLDDDQNVFRVDGVWRYRKRSRVEFSYFDLSRDTRAPVNIDIRWGDEFFSIGTPLDTVLDLEIIQGSWGYTFYRTPQWDAHATIGLFVMDIRAGLRDLTTGDVDEEGDVTAPLPVIGIGFVYKITPKLHLSAKIQNFEIETDDAEGSLLDTVINITHNTFKNVGFGAGFNSLDMDIDSEDDDFEGKFDLDYDGLIFFTKVYF